MLQHADNILYPRQFGGAFNQAFKREYGTPPATWRREQVSMA